MPAKSVQPAPMGYVIRESGDLSDDNVECFLTLEEANQFIEDMRIAFGIRVKDSSISRENVLDAGDYMLGDPGAILSEECGYLLDLEEEGVFKWGENLAFAQFKTLVGDGIYQDEQGFSYAIDTGLIGVYPLEMTRNRANEKWGRRTIRMNQAFTVGKKARDGRAGLVVIGSIEIDTSSP